MTKDELWAAYTAKNPQFSGDGTVTLSAAGLRKLFEQSWEKGRENGFANGQAWEQNKAKISASKKDPFNDLMRSCGVR